MAGPLLAPGIHYPDEVMQSLEQAHRLVFGYGLVPWEFRDGARSWLLPGLLAGPMWLGGVIAPSTDAYRYLAQALVAALSASSVVIGFYWGLRFSRWHGILAAVVLGTWFELVYFGARALGEVVASAFLFAGVFLCSGPPDIPRNARRAFLAGLCLEDYIGLFGYVGSGGQVKNLGVINAAIQGRQCVGGLVAYNYFGTITSSYATGSITGGSCVGGLVAYNASGTITSCYATGAVRGKFTGTKDVGGLLGDNSATITSCYATGAVSGSYGAGGLPGSNWGTITSCYATGAVSGFRTVGGLVGYAKNGAITSCYATGAVSRIGTSSLYVGGLVGSNSATITSCYMRKITLKL